MSPPWKSITEPICAQLASRLRWLSTTPFGAPSDPLVNSTTAGASGSVDAPGRRRARHASRLARSFARRPIDARTSSSQTKRTSSAMRSTILVSRPFSTNARLEITVRTPAVRQADSIAGRAGRNVQQARHDAERLQPHERHHRGDRVGHQQRHMRFARRDAGQRASQRSRTHHHPVVADRHARDVLGDDRPRAIRVARVQQCREQVPAGVLRAEHRVHHHVPQGAAGRLAALPRRQIVGVRRRERDRRQDVQSNRREPAQAQLAAHAAETAELQSLDADRHDQRLRPVGDHRGAFVDLHQPAGAGHAAFGKDHQLAPVVAHRLDHALHRIGRLHVHRKRLDRGEERLEVPLRGLRRMDGEGRDCRAGRQRSGRHRDRTGGWRRSPRGRRRPCSSPVRARCRP